MKTETGEDKTVTGETKPSIAKAESGNTGKSDGGSNTQKVRKSNPAPAQGYDYKGEQDGIGDSWLYEANGSTIRSSIQPL